MDKYLNIAVLGNPNKGKSSLVSTLAYDDNVKVSSFSGETVVSQSFDLILNNQIIYKLYDTPGFNNEDELLNFIDEKELEKESNKLKILEQFKAKYQFTDDCDKEIEIIKVLLTSPIIFFVIDSSKKFQKDYESQLEFIKWLNFPTIAVYNQISSQDFKADWEGNISKYIKTSIELNIFDIDLNKKILLLQKALELNLSNLQKQNIKKAIEVLNIDYNLRIEKSVESMSTWISTVTTFEKKYKMPIIKLDTKTQEEYFQEFKKEYFQELSIMEKEYQKKLEKIWGFSNLNLKMDKYDISLYPLDSDESIELFGISSKDIKLVGASLGAVSGAGVGSSIDFLGGMGLGTTIGGFLGAITGIYTTSFLQEYIDVQTKSLGKQVSFKLGPIKDINLLLSIIVRAIVHINKIKQRSHAKRDELDIKNIGENIFEDNSKRKNILRLAMRLHYDNNKYEEEFKEIIKEKLSL